MTAIVGLVHDGDVYMGGDAAGATDNYIASRTDPKVFQNGPFMMGFTSSFRMGQLLKYAFEAPTPPVSEEDLMKFMATQFIDAIRSCLRNGGWSEMEKMRETGGNFLVATKGRLFEIEADFQVNEERQGYAACGSGALLALGSLHTTRMTEFGRPDFGPFKRVELALRAAEAHNPRVCGPYTILIQKG